MVSRTVFVVAVTVAAFGGAGIDRVITARAEVSCPIGALTAPPELARAPEPPPAPLPPWTPIPTHHNKSF